MRSWFPNFAYCLVVLCAYLGEHFGCVSNVVQVRGGEHPFIQLNASRWTAYECREKSELFTPGLCRLDIAWPKF